METNKNWTAVSTRFGMSPIAPVQGSGLPFAGYGAAQLQHLTADVTARPDAKVPDPRGRLH